ncbi:MAG: HPr(Ser) kinase/phosphatase [Oscillospiraceae bacterium]|jgi:HPr kinase/phosphorylase
MASEYKVSLAEFRREIQIDPVYLPCDESERFVETVEVNRAGLLLAGFTEHMNAERIEICGNVEIGYLESLGNTERLSSIDLLFSECPPAVIVAGSKNQDYDLSEFKAAAMKYGVPLYHSDLNTSEVLSDSISYLNGQLGPRITRHGVLVEVYGEGILMLGESGIGKSETAIELVKRGHRFIADDAVVLKKVSHNSIVGSSPENIKHYIELRGIGIINVMRIFGMGAVKESTGVDLVIKLEQWESGKTYTKIGLGDEDMLDILGVKIPMITVPVRPGRNMAVIVETAAMNNREKKMGYNSAEELMDQLGMDGE